jgi:hypothetical protein
MSFSMPCGAQSWYSSNRVQPHQSGIWGHTHSGAARVAHKRQRRQNARTTKDKDCVALGSGTVHPCSWRSWPCGRQGRCPQGMWQAYPPQGPTGTNHDDGVCARGWGGQALREIRCVEGRKVQGRRGKAIDEDKSGNQRGIEPGTTKPRSAEGDSSETWKCRAGPQT